MDKFSQDEGEQENADALEQTKVEDAPKKDDEDEDEFKDEESKIKTIFYIRYSHFGVFVHMKLVCHNHPFRNLQGLFLS